MKQALVWLLLITSFFAKAQEFPSDLWHEGYLVLVNEDTLTGKLKYNLERDLVQVETSDKTYTFSAQKIFFFQIFDQTTDTYRQFYVLPYALVNQYEAPVIFEVLFEGKLTLLCREAIVMKTEHDNNPYPYGSRMSYSREVLEYTYYFLDDKGNIREYSMKKKDLLNALKDRAGKVNEFMKVNHLRADKRLDLIRIISFYNGII
ncbi:MAG: hypothetical protein KDC79_10040 [Cyclobacteriaceae bacterium]|nr:hypothetical protein [Cyclobacteriaceae bacterium]